MLTKGVKMHRFLFGLLYFALFVIYLLVMEWVFNYIEYLGDDLDLFGIFVFVGGLSAWIYICFLK